MAGTKASEPVVVAESSTPNPLFGGSYSSVIYGAGQKVGIKILALADDPNHTPLTDAPVAIKNDITVDANNTWSWRYTLGSTVHPLTLRVQDTAAPLASYDGVQKRTVRM